MQTNDYGTKLYEKNEIIKAEGETLMMHVRLLLNELLIKGKIPNKWRNAEVS